MFKKYFSGGRSKKFSSERILGVSTRLPLLMVGLNLVFPVSAQSQTRGQQPARGYQGQPSGVTRFDRDRDFYPECAKYVGDPKNPIPRSVYDACVDAAAAAEAAAYWQATPIGCEDGYFAGFSQGLYEGSNLNRSDRVAQDLGFQDGIQNAFNFESRTEPAQSDGQRLGEQQGSSHAREDWVNALNRGAPQSQPRPAASLQYSVSQSPFKSPYHSMGLPDRSLPEMIEAEKWDSSTLALYREDLRRSRSRLCARFNGRNRQNWRPADYYRDNGRYSYQPQRAYDGAAAFDSWISSSPAVDSRDLPATRRGDSRSGPTRSAASPQRYRELQNQVIRVQPEGEKPATDAAGGSSNTGATRNGNSGSSAGSSTPGSSSDSTATSGATRGAGGTRGEPGQARVRDLPMPVDTQRTTPTPTPAQPSVVYNLGEIYRNTFKNAYSYYAEEAYSRGFFALLDDGANDGWQIGLNVGYRFAVQNGRVMGFNHQFRQLEQQAYQRGYQNQYGLAYSKMFEYYRTTPVIAAQILEIMGATDDGILQPGETIYAVYEVSNYGGVTAQLQAQLQGEGIEKSNVVPISVPAGRSSKFADTRLVGVLNSSLFNFSQPEILLSVTGGHQPQLTSIRREVTRQVTLEGVSAVANSPTGLANVQVTLLNRSPKLQTPDDVKIWVTPIVRGVVLTGSSVYSANLGRLSPGQKLVTPLVGLTQIPGLALLNEQVAVEVRVDMGSTGVTRSGNVRVRQPSETRLKDLARIFDGSAQRSEPQMQAEARAALAQITSEVGEEVKNIKNNRYAQQPEGTLMYELVLAYRSHPQSDSAKGWYRELAGQLREFSKRLRGVGVFSSKGLKEFNRWLTELEG